MKVVLFATVFCSLILIASPVRAVTISTSQPGPYTVGDYTVSANIVGAGTGTLYDLLRFGTKTVKVGRGNSAIDVLLATAYDGSTENPTGTPPTAKDDTTHNTSLGDVWNFYDDSGITSTDHFIFGLDVHEPEGGDKVSLDIQTLDVMLGNKTYTLGTDTLTIYQVGTGSGTADVLFDIDLGYDFMTAYNPTSGLGSLPDLGFKITAKHLNEEGTFEEYFIDAGYYSTSNNPSPEPATVALFGIGLGGLAMFRRKRDN